MASPPPNTPSVELEIVRWSRSRHVEVADPVVTEEPLEIRVRSGPEAPYGTLAITMRTPGDDVELAVGFIYGEGLLVGRSDLLEAAPCTTTTNVVNVTVRADLDLAAATQARRFYTTSSCGLCGRSSLDAVAAALKGRRVEGTRVVGAPTLTALPGLLRARQTVFQATGGLHTVRRRRRAPRDSRGRGKT
jgi:FdhD protein